MYKMFAFVFLFHLYLSAQWIALTNVPTTDNLNDAYFIDSNIGYVVGDDGTIIKTTNGGTIWTVQNSGINNNINSVFFTSDSIGYAVAGKWDLIYYRYSILKTVDGGNIWNNIKSGIYNKLLSVFIDNNKGFASGIDTIFITTTGGESWSAEEIPINRSFNSIFFVNEYLGYVVGLNRAIYKTQSGGSNWFPQESGIFSVNSFNSVFFTDELNGYVVGTSGTYLKTTNGGDVWQSGYFGATSSLNDIFFLNEGDGYIVGDNGKIYKTTDMGNGWIEESSGTTNTLSCACFPNSNIGFIVGGNGTILKNENIVTSVKSSSGSFLTTSFKLLQNFPNPFNPTTKIRFTVPNVETHSHASLQLKVYDILGNELTTLVNEQKPPGTYEVEFDAKGLTSGIYFYKLTVGEFSETRKMLLLK